MKKNIQELIRFYFLALPIWARLVSIFLLGGICGLTIVIINISNFFSYLSDDPKTCINCHIMVPEYVTWFHSSHREVTNCNDCHVPHNNILNKYLFKANDGMRHAAIYTMRGEAQSIIMREAGVKTVQENCLRCHSKIFENKKHEQTKRLCWDCHQEVPHGKNRSLAASPYARAPTTKSMIPDWLNTILKKEEKK